MVIVVGYVNVCAARVPLARACRRLSYPGPSRPDVGVPSLRTYCGSVVTVVVDVDVYILGLFAVRMPVSAVSGQANTASCQHMRQPVHTRTSQAWN